jgi:predicted 3-demethylubiquinone-9 3-methyltransferase (glyoxalase superfamily)
MSKITPFLWFDDKAEEAAEFYVKVFSEWSGASGTSKVHQVARYGDAGPGVPGSAMTVAFELEGQRFTALNGGPDHTFTDAISLLVDCASQQEVDQLWSALTEGGGEEGPCGWLKDRYGLSWQIIPTVLPALLGDADPSRAQRAMEAMLQMKKIDIAKLQRAADAA